MPSENSSFRPVCGLFAAVFVFFMEQLAKLAAIMFRYNTRARRVQVQCVFLTVVLMQILLCASDIETHPGPNVELEQTLQRMFDQPEKRLDTLFSSQFETRFETVGNQLSTKVVCALSVVKTQLVNLQAKVMDLKEHNMVMADAQRKTRHAVQTLKQKLVDLSMDVDDRLDKFEAFSRRDNLKFFNIPQSPNENYDTCTATLLEFLQNLSLIHI